MSKSGGTLLVVSTGLWGDSRPLSGERKTFAQVQPKRAAPVLMLMLLSLTSVVVVLKSAEAASFTPLGDLAGGPFESRVVDASDDGSVAVGYSRTDAGIETFHWTSGTMVGLGSFGVAEAASADGSVVVGYTGGEAFRWTSEGGTVGLGDLPGGIFFSIAFGVSRDGSVVVGSGQYGNTWYWEHEAFRWTGVGGMVSLGDLPGGIRSSTAYGVSVDGSVVVGRSASSSSEFPWSEAFRWQSATGMVGMGDLPGGIFNSVAYDVSADGTVAVGYGSSVSGNEAFRWTPGGGMVGLSDVPGRRSEAYGVSADGAVVVGLRSTAVWPYTEAFIWTSDSGMRDLRSLLVNAGATGLTGWSLTEAMGISADGRTIVGNGINPAGESEGWIARLVPAGDYNFDGIVDAADYVFWRKNDGTTARFEEWRAHFSDAVESGIPTTPVPEPPNFVLVILALGVGSWKLYRTRGPSTNSD